MFVITTIGVTEHVTSRADAIGLISQTNRIEVLALVTTMVEQVSEASYVL